MFQSKNMFKKYLKRVLALIDFSCLMSYFCDII